MGKRIKANPTPSETRRIEAAKSLGGLVRFSFKYFQDNHATYDPTDCKPGYFLSLLDRLRELSRLEMRSLQNRKADSTIRFHRIDFTDKRVSSNGFGIPKCELFDEEAWQFSLTANEYGRVHGFVIEDTFFVVWFDPDHQLYHS